MQNQQTARLYAVRPQLPSQQAANQPGTSASFSSQQQQQPPGPSNRMTPQLGAGPSPRMLQPLPGPSSNLSTFRRSFAPPPSRSPPTVQNQSIFFDRGSPHHLDQDPHCAELLTRLFVSQGIPMHAVTDPTFIELIKHLNPSTVIPTENTMQRGLNKHCKNPKPVANYQKTVGPLSCTVDVAGNQDEKYLAFSIHYFEDLYERKNIVYLKKLLLSQVDSDSILISIRRAINSYSYSTVRFANLVSPSEEIQQLLCSSDSIQRFFVCFTHYVNKFVTELLKIKELSDGLEQLRTFARFIKGNAEVYGKYRRIQLLKRAEIDIPTLDDGSWMSIARFLTKCLVLHDDFNEACERLDLKAPITNDVFLQLLYFQRLLNECVKHVRELSAANNSVSQVVPALMSLRNFISITNAAHPYQTQVVTAFQNSFQAITRGSIQNRYDLSTLMDPRYAYRPEIYSNQRWATLEIRAIEEFCKFDSSMAKCFYNDISLMSSEERVVTMRQDFEHYRNLLLTERPEESDSPNFWWGRRQTDMEFLSVLAREYLAPPATCIDASFHFNKGKGKFDRICKEYNRPLIDEYLTVAGAYQPYRGKGFPSEKNEITDEQMKTLEAISKRIQTGGIVVRKFQGGSWYDGLMGGGGQQNPGGLEPKTEPMDTVEEQKPEMLLPSQVRTGPPPIKKGRGILRR